MVKTSFEKFKNKHKGKNTKHVSSSDKNSDYNRIENESRSLNHNNTFSSKINVQSTNENLTQNEMNDSEEDIKNMGIADVIKLMSKKSSGKNLTEHEKQIIQIIETTDITKSIVKKVKRIRNIIIFFFITIFLISIISSLSQL